MQNTVDPQLGASSRHRPGKQRRTRRDEDLVLDRRAVDVRVRADQDGIAQRGGVHGPPPHQRVLHDHHVRARPHLPVLGGQHGPVQHPRPLPQYDGPAQHGGRRDVRGLGNHRSPAAMLQQHA
ncbi:hypothetical protein [Streptomyces sp. 8N616]|uniref:hypothetical protein n=1 Tax=Streptomyces sp. 8N616 TaxID=3457414 RepID=UPI003FCF1B16